MLAQTTNQALEASPVGGGLPPLSSAASNFLTAENKGTGSARGEHRRRQESTMIAVGRVADSKTFFHDNGMDDLLETATGEKSCCECQNFGEKCVTCRKVSQIAFTFVTSLALVPMYWRGSAGFGVEYQLGCVAANVLQSILYGSETYTFLEQINNKPPVRSALAILLALITIYPPVSLTYLNEATAGNAGLGVLFALMTFVGDLPLNIYSMYYFVNRVASLFELTTARKYLLDEMRAATNGGTGPSGKTYGGDPKFKDSVGEEVETWVKVVGGILGFSIIGLGLAYGLTGYDCAAAAMFGGEGGLGWTENPKNQLILGLMSNSPIILMSLLMSGMDNGIAMLDALTKMKCKNTSVESQKRNSSEHAELTSIAVEPSVSVNTAASAGVTSAAASAAADEKGTLIPSPEKSALDIEYERKILKLQIAWGVVAVVAVLAAAYSYKTSTNAFEKYCPDLFGKIGGVQAEDFKNPTLGVGTWFAVSMQLIAAMTSTFNGTFGTKAVRGLYGAHKKSVNQFFDKEKRYIRAGTDLQQQQVGEVADWVRSAPDELVEREAGKLGWQRNPRWYDSCVTMFSRWKSSCRSTHAPLPMVEMPPPPAAAPAAGAG